MSHTPNASEEGKSPPKFVGWKRFLFAWLAGCGAAGASGYVCVSIFDGLQRYGYSAAGIAKAFESLLLSLLLSLVWPGPVLLVLILALIVAVPFVVGGTGMIALSAFWRPARSWIFWASASVACALILDPWFDSRYLDPLPPMDSTIRSLGAALGGSTMMWFLAQSRALRKDTSNVGRLCAALIGIVLISGSLGWRSWYAAQHPWEVRGRTEAFVHEPQIDAVSAKLFEYVPERAGQSRFLTTGRSLTFRFPANFKGAVQIGHPKQNELTIHARLADFSPVTNGWWKAKAQDIAVRIMPANELVAPNYGKDFARIIEREPDEEIGTMCGLRFANESWRTNVFESVKRDWPATFPSSDLEMVAAAAGPNPLQVTGAICAAKTKCIVSFAYNGFDASFWLERKKLCQWPLHTARVRKFLDSHLLSVIDPRPN